VCAAISDISSDLLPCVALIETRWIAGLAMSLVSGISTNTHTQTIVQVWETDLFFGKFDLECGSMDRWFIGRLQEMGDAVHPIFDLYV
jgi:hypothetical protein